MNGCENFDANIFPLQPWNDVLSAHSLAKLKPCMDSSAMRCLSIMTSDELGGRLSLSLLLFDKIDPVFPPFSKKEVECINTGKAHCRFLTFGNEGNPQRSYPLHVSL